MARESPEQAKELVPLLIKEMRVHNRRRIIPPIGFRAAVRAIPSKVELAGLEPASSVCYDVAILMARLQVSLPPEDHRRARARAAELGISFAEYIRWLVSRDLGEDRGVSDPQALFDLGDSGGSDVARDKQRHLGEAVESKR